MATGFQYLYLHGFCSDVQTKKGVTLKKRFAEKGIPLHLFDVKGGKRHEDARVSIALQALDDWYRENQKPLRLIGSSMGGFISALYASKHPTHVDRVILMNPAVNLKETWTTIADSKDVSVIEKWKADGELEVLAGTEQQERVKMPYAYVEDSLQYPNFPDVPCPALVLAGTHDALIPPKNAYVLQLEQENPDRMNVIELDDDHELMKDSTIDRIFNEALQFFGVH